MKEVLNKKKYLIDANGKILGRLATHVATVLYGKNKVDFTPNKDNGDMVIVINAAKIKVTGNKIEAKTYYRHSGYPGGIKSATLKEVMEKSPEKAIISAVKGMLPKNKLGTLAQKRLRVYKDENYKEKGDIITL